MARAKEIPFAWQSYQSRSLPWSAQRLVNWYAEAGIKGAKTQMALIGAPGLVEHADAGAGPIRGQHTMAGEHFVVSGTQAFKINSAGSETLLGTIPGSDIVVMDDNGTEIAVAANGDGHIITTSTVTAISDADFIGIAGTIDSVTYMDSFFVWNVGQLMQNSEALDGLSYRPLDVATAEYGPDGALRVFRDHDQLFVFGTNSVEIWYNAGLEDFPFAPTAGAVMEVGITAKNSVAKVDNSVFWLGSDERGGLTIWRAINYQPVRISTHAIEKKLEDSPDISVARAFSYREEGHSFYVVTIPGEFTLVYDAATGLWHERETFQTSGWIAQNFASIFGKLLVGSSTDGKIFEMDLDTYTEDGGIIERLAASPTLQSGNEYTRHDMVRIDFEAGVGLTTGQGSDPQAMLSWSDDGGKTFKGEHFRSMGKIGEFLHRTYWRRLGTARTRNYQVRVTDPVKSDIAGGFTNIEPKGW